METLFAEGILARRVQDVGGEAEYASPFDIIVTRLNSSIIIVTVSDVVERRGYRVDEMLKLVANFGFPIVVSAYLLVRIEGKLAELTVSITELAKVIAVLKA